MLARAIFAAESVPGRADVSIRPCARTPLKGPSINTRQHLRFTREFPIVSIRSLARSVIPAGETTAARLLRSSWRDQIANDQTCVTHRAYRWRLSMDFVAVGRWLRSLRHVQMRPGRQRRRRGHVARIWNVTRRQRRAERQIRPEKPRGPLQRRTEIIMSFTLSCSRQRWIHCAHLISLYPR